MRFVNSNDDVLNDDSFFICSMFTGVQNNDPALQSDALLGSDMICFNRSFKYCFFDPTTQMAYIP